MRASAKRSRTHVPHPLALTESYSTASATFQLHESRHRFSPGIRTGHAVVGAAAFALQRVAAIDDTLAGDGEMPQPVVLLLDAGVGHRCHTVGAHGRVVIAVIEHEIEGGRWTVTVIVAAASIADWVDRRRGCPAS